MNVMYELLCFDKNRQYISIDKNPKLYYAMSKYNFGFHIVGESMDDIREAVRKLVIAISKIERTYAARSSKFGSQASELWLMYTLDDGEPHCQKQICAEWGIRKTTLNSVTKKCEAAGYLTLIPIPGKRRVMRICLTEKGKTHARHLLEQFYKAEDRAMEKTLKVYSSEFIDAVKYYEQCLYQEFSEET